MPTLPQLERSKTHLTTSSRHTERVERRSEHLRTTTTERLKSLQREKLMSTEKDLQKLYKFRLIDTYGAESTNEEKEDSGTLDKEQK